MLEYSLVLALIAVIAIPTVWRLGMGMKKPECEALHGLTIQAAWDEHLLMCMKEDGGMGFPEPWF